jgi:hypothetical protein
MGKRGRLGREDNLEVDAKKGEARKGRQGRGNKKRANIQGGGGLQRDPERDTKGWGRQKMGDERGTERKTIWKRGDKGGGETKNGKTRNAIRKKGDEEQEMK